MATDLMYRPDDEITMTFEPSVWLDRCIDVLGVALSTSFEQVRHELSAGIVP
jgi:hypothetical protein